MDGSLHFRWEIGKVGEILGLPSREYIRGAKALGALDSSPWRGGDHRRLGLGAEGLSHVMIFPGRVGRVVPVPGPAGGVAGREALQGTQPRVQPLGAASLRGVTVHVEPEVNPVRLLEGVAHGRLLVLRVPLLLQGVHYVAARLGLLQHGGLGGLVNVIVVIIVIVVVEGQDIPAGLGHLDVVRGVHGELLGVHVEAVANGALSVRVGAVDTNIRRSVDLQRWLASTAAATTSTASRSRLVLVVAGRPLEAAVAGAPLELARAGRVRALQQAGPGGRGGGRLHV